jgi:hypothetical protein
MWPHGARVRSPNCSVKVELETWHERGKGETEREKERQGKVEHQAMMELTGVRRGGGEVKSLPKKKKRKAKKG